MFDFNAIHAAATDMGTVTDLTGNCGRAVRRTFERYFIAQSDGSAIAKFPVAANVEPLVFAALVQRALEQSAAIDFSILEFSPAGMFKAKIADVDVAKRVFNIQLTLKTPPESVKERQACLSNAIMELQFMVRTLEGVPTTVEAVLLNRFGSGSYTGQPERTAQYLAQFDKLLQGHYDELGSTPMILVTMAGLLNRDVLRASDEYDKAHPLDAEPQV